MNRDQLKGEWHKLKGKVKQHWADLTDDEIDKIDGKTEEFAGTLQRKYGYSKEKANKEIDRFLESIDDKNDNK